MKAALRPPSLVLAGLCLALPLAAQPCGPHDLPKDAGADPQALDLRISTRHAAFDIQGRHGSLTELSAEGRYHAGRGFFLGARAPLEFLSLHGDGDATGPGDPSAYVEQWWRPAVGQALSAGLRIAFPLGDRDRGLGSGHVMASPYLAWIASRGPYHFGALVGGLYARMDGAGPVSASDHAGMGHAQHAAAGHTPLYVHPHGNLEAQGRLESGRRFAGGRFSPTLALSGQRVLEDMGGHAPGDWFLTVEAVPHVRLGEVAVSPRIEFPLSPAKRQEWSLGLGIGGYW